MAVSTFVMLNKTRSITRRLVRMASRARPWIVPSRNRTRQLARAVSVLALIAVIVNCGPATPNMVLGNSMAPTILNWDVRLLDRMYPHTDGIKRDDIVIVQHEGELLTKRVRALPGDTVFEVWFSDSRKALVVSAEIGRHLERKTKHLEHGLSVLRVQLAKDEYYVAGDNVQSFDSREFGPVHREEFVGLSRPLTWKSVRKIADEVSGIIENKVDDVTEFIIDAIDPAEDQ